MGDAEGFEAFVAVVEAGSVSAAARVLGVPRPTLSRQLARLEQRLGVRLLHRSTRRVVTTRAGEALFRRARHVVDEARAAVAEVQRLDDVPRGLLRVSAPPAVDGQIAEVVASFLDLYPEVHVELLTSSRHVDLVGEGVDVAVRGGATAGSDDLVARRLFATDLVAVASPTWLDARGRPATAAALTDHTCILGVGPGDRPTRRWPLLDGGHVDVDGRLVTNDVIVRRVAAVRGLGVALLPRPLVQGALDEGALEEVLPGVVGQPGSAQVLYVERAFLDPKVRAFVDHLVASLAGRSPPC